MDPQQITLPTNPFVHPGLNYEALRLEGLQHIERLGKKLWTHYNPSDSGITLLEALCYAITDVSYRINHDIKDLLATPTGNNEDSFYTPQESLTTQPVTFNDLRKLLIDIDGIKNAWVEIIGDDKPTIYFQDTQRQLSIWDEEQAKPPEGAKALAIKGLYQVVLEHEVKTHAHTEVPKPIRASPETVRYTADLELHNAYRIYF